MKQKSNIALCAALLVLAGCASIRTVTDTVTLYPDNQAAQKWGVLTFYTQYQSNQRPNQLTIALPNGKELKGQLTYVQETGNIKSDGSFWDNVSFGIGVGSHHGGFGGVSIGTRSGSYQSDKLNVSLNAFGDNVGLNCQGEFNQKQNNGTLNCQLTNGMRYRGTLRRVAVK